MQVVAYTLKTHNINLVTNVKWVSQFPQWHCFSTVHMFSVPLSLIPALSLHSVLSSGASMSPALGVFLPLSFPTAWQQETDRHFLARWTISQPNPNPASQTLRELSSLPSNVCIWMSFCGCTLCASLFAQWGLGYISLSLCCNRLRI